MQTVVIGALLLVLVLGGLVYLAITTPVDQVEGTATPAPTATATPRPWTTGDETMDRIADGVLVLLGSSE